ncbi:hypothetical protein HaLaN_06692 [Haematococcus lacustris]|uniref:Uncharacterized protein n=1 Tax=Haematococcus lacustris TaxID=44745 RepID=A0A699YWL7_HAELA|nr:hypothetical protein HaLaN_06692 [Haematococcus lacustris]
MNSPQPCEEELNRSKPTRPEDWKPQPGHPWGPWQMGGQGLQRSPQPPAGRGEQVAPTGAVQVATPRKASSQGQGSKFKKSPSISLARSSRSCETEHPTFCVSSSSTSLTPPLLEVSPPLPLAPFPFPL